jgi:hypothetical protein
MRCNLCLRHRVGLPLENAMILGATENQQK